MTTYNMEAGRENNNQNVLKHQRLSLWLFLYETLQDKTKQHMIKWLNIDELTFKILDGHKLAKAWGRKKGRENMTYPKFLRALRYYYGKDVLEKVPGIKSSYRFLRSNKTREVLPCISQRSSRYNQLHGDEQQVTISCNNNEFSGVNIRRQSSSVVEDIISNLGSPYSMSSHRSPAVTCSISSQISPAVTDSMGPQSSQAIKDSTSSQSCHSVPCPISPQRRYTVTVISQSSYMPSEFLSDDFYWEAIIEELCNDENSNSNLTMPNLSGNYGNNVEICQRNEQNGMLPMDYQIPSGDDYSFNNTISCQQPSYMFGQQTNLSQSYIQNNLEAKNEENIRIFNEMFSDNCNELSTCLSCI